MKLKNRLIQFYQAVQSVDKVHFYAESEAARKRALKSVCYANA